MVSYNGKFDPPVGVGEYEITAEYGGDGKGYGPATTEKAKLTIDPLLLTATADAKEMTFGDKLPEATGKVEGALPEDGISGKFEHTAKPDSPPGDYVINAVLDDTKGRLVNYQISLNRGKLTIKPSSEQDAFRSDWLAADGRYRKAVREATKAELASTEFKAPSAGARCRGRGVLQEQDRRS